jgi:hypothetical protein
MAEGEWAKSNMHKDNLLAKHFEAVFKPQPSELPPAEEQKVLHAFASPVLPLPFAHLTVRNLASYIWDGHKITL